MITKKFDTCLLDMDGVLVNFHLGIIKKYNIAPEQLKALPKPWPWSWILDVTETKWDEFFDDLSVHFWEHLDWTPFGQDLLKNLENYFGFDNIYILTNPCLRSHSVEGKFRWLKREMPRYYDADKIIMAGAKHVCAWDDRLLVDDSEKNHKDFIEAGGHGLLIPTMWNSNWMIGPNSVSVLFYVESWLDYHGYQS